MFCTNCGHELAPEAKFCSNCGAPVNTTGASPESPFETPAERRERERREDFASAWGTSYPSDEPAQHTDADEVSHTPQETSTYDGGFATKSATWEVERAKLRSGDLDDEWSMSNLGPAKPQRRRTWLWVVLGLIVTAVIACCVFGWWLLGTDSGKEFMDNIEVQLTQTAEAIQRATEVPATPQP